ncbi:MAG: 6-phosphofructokinase [Firmicutes bacterium]|nr:6-phosphofructokinase [Bacillota bacterium]
MQTETRHLNILVGQSGGPTAVINSTLYGILKTRSVYPEITGIYGMINGIEGYLKGSMIDLSLLSQEEQELLKTTPGAYLGSCRYKMPEDQTSPIYQKMFDRLTEDQIDIVLYIGGNDSMDTVAKLSDYALKTGSSICFVGIPKTIDNDLCETDHTPGYGSAAKFVASNVRQIVMDAEVYQTKAVTIVEIMGRNAGWLTAAAKAARKYPEDNPVLIYLPEVNFYMDQMLNDVRELLKTKNAIVICISEGIHDEHGTLICEMGGRSATDVFGHKLLAGAGKVLENTIRQELGVKVRSVELNVTQRSSAVEASFTDVMEAVACGVKGVELAMEGWSGFMVTMHRIEDKVLYDIDYRGTKVTNVSNEVKSFPEKWITKGGTDISDEFLSYLIPLIQGESYPPMENGLPRFIYRKQSIG